MPDDNFNAGPARNDTIVLMYSGGDSLREIAKARGISHERVRQILRARGVVLRSSRARALDGAIRSLGTPLNVKE